MMHKIVYLIWLLTFTLGQNQQINMNKFPDDFAFGVATSAYQTEGAWNKDGKTESIWDYITHHRSEFVIDGSNGDIACDSYHKFHDDLKLLKELGVDFYRFSLSWSRILPSGFSNKVNQIAINYYNSVIDGLLANNITPMVTLFHWDLPLSLMHQGGGASPLFLEWFEDYATVIFDAFGDRVKLWITINEPKTMCKNYYSIIGPELWKVGEYTCNQNFLKAHARVYHLYDELFRPKQKGQISIALDCHWREPGSNSTKDIEAADRALQLDCGMFAHPIFTKEGDYPTIVKGLTTQRSKEEGFSQSPLHSLTTEEIQYIKQTYDFFALNHYTTYLVVDAPPQSIEKPFLSKEMQILEFADPKWINSSFIFFKSVPWGFRKMLKWVKQNYEDPDIYVAENGFADNEMLQDERRIVFLTDYLRSLLDAIYLDGVKIKGYTYWGLLDQFEWLNGYTTPFGLYFVNHTDPNRTRIPRDSAKFYRELIKTHELKPQKI